MTGSLSAEHGDIVVGVLGEVADTTIKAQRGSVDLLAGAKATNVKITADHSFLSLPDDPHDPAEQHVTVFVAGNLDGTIRARHSADIETIGGTDDDQNSTPGNVDLKVKVSAGPIDVMSGGTLAGTFKATGDVAASAMGGASGLYRSSESNVSLSTVGAINATVKGEGTATVFAGETINGLVRGGTTAEVTSGDNMDATVKAGTDADVMVVGGSLGGDVTAAKGAATVTVTGGVIAASITGRVQVDAWTQDGIQSGTLSTSAGPVNVTSMGDILSDAEINAHGGDATVYGNASVDGLIYSTQNTHVTAMAGSAADVIAELNVDLFAGGDSTGAVWAGDRATVTTTGDITGDVRADIGDAIVSANGQITSDIDAGQNAFASALGAITGGAIQAGAKAEVTTWANLASTVTANSNANVWAYESITSPITAGANATAFAKQNVAGNITAGQAANVTAMAWVGGHVTAGTDAVVTANGDVGGVVDAGENADVFAMGNITGGSITASAGDVNATAFSDITALLIAGGDVDGFAMGDMSIGQVTAGGNADLVAMGACAQLMLVDAGGNANITSYGALIAPAVKAGGDADLFAMGPTVVDITASTNASVFSDDDVEANVVATADADVTSLGASLKAILNAGADALAYTAGAITASVVDAVGSASMIALAQIANSTVDGDAEAFAMSGSDMTFATVSSVTGATTAISTGSIASTTLNAGGDARLVAVSEVSTTGITAGAALTAISGSSMVGVTMNAGTDVTVASYGTLHLSNLTAGEDVSLLSVGDMTANVDAGGTLSAATFGNLDGVFEAEDDITEIVARGRITGTYTSHDNVDAVFSYDEIDADITAEGTADPSDADGDGYGAIGEVVAWRGVHGTLNAPVKVEKVQGGEDVAATQNTPEAEQVISNDRTSFVGFGESLPWRIGSLKSGVTDMERGAESMSELLGLGKDSLDRRFDAASRRMQAEQDALSQQIFEMQLASAAQSASQNGQLLLVIVDATTGAVWVGAATESELEDAIARAGVLDQQAQVTAAQFRQRSATNDGEVQTAVTAYKGDIVGIAAQTLGTANATNSQAQQCSDASKTQVDVVANAHTRAGSGLHTAMESSWLVHHPLFWYYSTIRENNLELERRDTRLGQAVGRLDEKGNLRVGFIIERREYLPAPPGTEKPWYWTQASGVYKTHQFVARGVYWIPATDEYSQDYVERQREFAEGMLDTHLDSTATQIALQGTEAVYDFVIDLPSLYIGRVGGIGRLSREVLLDGEVTPDAMFNATVQTLGARAVPRPHKFTANWDAADGFWPHFTYSVGGKWRHAIHLKGGPLTVTRYSAQRLWGLSSRPCQLCFRVFDARAALQRGTIHRSCLNAVWKAYLRGNLVPITISTGAGTVPTIIVIQQDDGTFTLPESGHDIIIPLEGLPGLDE